MRSLAKSMCQEWNLAHPASVHPEDLLHFVYLDEFASDWRRLYPNDGDEQSLYALEIMIMVAPDGAPIVPGTGGLRKLRFGSAEAGKRGQNRICYAYFPEHHIVLMMMAYGKGQKETLSEGDKKGIKQYLQITSKWLDDHS